MRVTKLAGWGLAGTLAMMLAVLPTSGALAGKALVLKSEGTPVANGSPSHIGVLIHECVTSSDGKVVANNVSKDILSASTSSEEECPAGVSISGHISEVELKSSGKAALKGTLTISEPGPCIFNFTKFKPTFAVPGFATFEGRTKGKLNKELSNKTKGACAKTAEEEYFASASNEPFGEPFETALAS